MRGTFEGEPKTKKHLRVSAFSFVCKELLKILPGILFFNGRGENGGRHAHVFNEKPCPGKHFPGMHPINPCIAFCAHHSNSGTFLEAYKRFLLFCYRKIFVRQNNWRKQ